MVGRRQATSRTEFHRTPKAIDQAQEARSGRALGRRLDGELMVAGSRNPSLNTVLERDQCRDNGQRHQSYGGDKAFPRQMI